MMDLSLQICRERRLAAVQTTYGALLPAPSLTYSDMSTTIALSDAAMASSYEVASMMADETGDSSPNAASGDHLLFGSFDDVQVRSICSLLMTLHASVCALFCGS